MISITSITSHYFRGGGGREGERDGRGEGREKAKMISILLITSREERREGGKGRGEGGNRGREGCGKGRSGEGREGGKGGEDVAGKDARREQNVRERIMIISTGITSGERGNEGRKGGE